jgi:hypothetical protein
LWKTLPLRVYRRKVIKTLLLRLVALINRTSGLHEDAIAAGATLVLEKREWARTFAEIVKGAPVLQSEVDQFDGVEAEA